MAKTPVYMPKFGMTMVEAEIIEWHVEKGQAVAKGDPLCGIETEKTNTDLEAPADGYMGELLFEEGDSAEVGSILAYVYDSEEELEAEDGQAAAPSAPAAAAAPAPAPAKEETASTDEQPIPRTRRIIADNMKASLQQSAQLTHFREVCVDNLVAYKESLTGVSYTDLYLKALALAAAGYEKARMQFVGDKAVTLQAVDLGLAVALDDGLIVPAIRGVDKLTLTEIAAERKRVAEAARRGALAPGDLGGAVATLSNLGLQNIDFFTPILNTPESVLLGVGRIQRKPWIVGNAIVAASVTTFSLTFDHQVLDGKDAAEFLEAFARILEDPASHMA